MIEKIGTIRNPLSIVAIFAGIAEISGTAVLPFISAGNQSKFIWFLMLFPLLLVFLFFATLNFNHSVLYAPSDFRNEDNFFKSFRAASPDERAEKLRGAALEIESDSSSGSSNSFSTTSLTDQASSAKTRRRGAQARYLLAEELVLNKLSRELGGEVQRDVRFSGTGASLVFDGLVVEDSRVTAIEVKFFGGQAELGRRTREVLHSMTSRLQQLPQAMRSRFSLILAVATDAPSSQLNQLSEKLSSLMAKASFPVQVRVFNLDELEREFNLEN